MKTITFLFIVSVFINGLFGDEVSVMEGDSLTLQTDVPDIQTDDDLILTWTFAAQKYTIANINREAKTTFIYDDVLDGRFRDRLKLNNQTGDLTITNITTQHTGVYNVRIEFKRQIIERSFNVKSVINPESDQLKSVSVKDGESVTLHTDAPDIKKYDVIQWRFQGIRIAEFNKSASKISEDKRFKDKLQLDVQTGSLQIKNIRTDLSGLYEVDLTSISSSYTIHQSLTVTVSGEVKSVSAMKGDPVTIYTDVPDIKTYDQILLVFGCDEKRIAEANKQNKQFNLYGRIRDGLKLNDQTGDLTIKDIRTEDGGLYELKMSSRRRTIQRRFSVNVSERGLSPSAVAGISVFFILLAAAGAAGVIYYRRKIAEMDKTKILEVYEGKSVDLKTEVKDIQRVDEIEWRFKETLIAEINPANNIFRTYDGDKGLFIGKLNLNHQTGDLIVSDIREEQTGDYKLKIIRDGETSDKTFFVSIRYTMLKVNEGKSTDLKTEVTDIQRDDMIEWRFKETLIAEINPVNNIFSTYDGDYDLFRDKLKLNDQTGDLNINDIGQKHTGDYKLKIIRDGKTSYKRFIVFVRACTEKIERVSVNECDSHTLKNILTDIQRDDVIEWRFEETLIAEINPANNIFRTHDKGLFRDQLNLNPQTGDLNISDIRWKHEGVYKLKIIRDGETSYKRFNVILKDQSRQLPVYEGESVHLKTKVTDIKRDEKIEWRFGETLIAEINPANNIFNTSNDDLFRDKLKLNHQTGDLNINGFKKEHNGVYKLKIISGGKTSYKKYSVSVSEKIERVSVNECDSYTLKNTLTDIKKDDLIEWRFGETLIAQINPPNNIFSTYDGEDNIFRDKLTLNDQTGDLKINDIREKHSGDYKLKIISGGETSNKRFIVFVRASSREDLVRKREDPVEKRGDPVETRGDPVETRGGDSVKIEMQPLLPNSSQ